MSNIPQRVKIVATERVQIDTSTLGPICIPSEPTVRKGDRRRDKHGVCVAMGVIDKYVMWRRPGAAPYVMSLKEWFALAPDA